MPEQLSAALAVVADLERVAPGLRYELEALRAILTADATLPLPEDAPNAADETEPGGDAESGVTEAEA